MITNKSKKDECIESPRETSEVYFSGSKENISYVESQNSNIISEENSEFENSGENSQSSYTNSQIYSNTEENILSSSIEQTEPNSIKKSKYVSTCTIKLRNALNHWITQIIGALLTIYILFADDVKMITTDYRADDYFSGICVLIMFCFVAEFIISSIVLEDYLFSFYFWLDFVSIISILLDVHWFYDFIISAATGEDVENVGTSKVKSVAAIVKASRGAKVGSRAIRILRILRIIRIVRISKLYKAREKIMELNVKNEMIKKNQKNLKNRKSYMITFNKIDNKFPNGEKKNLNTNSKIMNIQNESINSLKIKNLQVPTTNMLQGSKLESLTKLKRISFPDELNAKLKSDKLLREIKKRRVTENPGIHMRKKLMTNIIQNPLSEIKINLDLTENKNIIIPKNFQSRKSKKERTTLKSHINIKCRQENQINESNNLNQILPINLTNLNHMEMINNNKNQEEDLNNIPEESKVGKKLSDRTSKRVIVIIISIIFGIILFNSSFYIENTSSMEFGLQMFKEFDKPYGYFFNLTFEIYVKEHLTTSSPLLHAQVGNLIYGDFETTLTLREYEKIIVVDDCTNFDNFTKIDKIITDSEQTKIPDENIFICVAIFDNRSNSKLISILNIIKTIFICFILAGSIFFFNKDASEMVLQPIESMIMKIKEISKNPLEAMQINEREEFSKMMAEEEEKTKGNIKNGEVSCSSCMGEIKKKNSKNTKINKVAPLETVVLEDTITKIGALLALGFGEAGCEIISKNMQNNSNGDINPILPGKKVIAIYGFCDIRNFTDTTEVLKEKVMIFVNEIAEIIHEITAEHCGSANKNIGDAFLLVWKFEEEYVIKNDNGEISLKNCPAVNQICDMALVNFIKILAKIQKSYKLDKYRKIPGLNKIIKNYQVKMGFGLHLGWSIEGAIGSSFKIDASYLSPHVNMASKLEEKTKDYGVPIVLSEEFVNYLSDAAKRRTRILDVSVNDEKQKRFIYTVDLDMNSLKIEEIEKEEIMFTNDIINKENLIKFISKNKIEKFRKRIKRKKNLEDAVNNKIEVWKNFEETDEDFFLMRKRFKPEFYEYYNKGFVYYIKGDWMEAKIHFEKAENILGENNYLMFLKNYIAQFNFKRPSLWKGNIEEQNEH